MNLTSMQRLALSNLEQKPQRLMALVDPVAELERAGYIVPVDGHEWRLYEITPRGRESLNDKVSDPAGRTETKP